jgi:hypothetical protein
MTTAASAVVVQAVAKTPRPFIGYAGLAARGSQATDVRDVTAIVVSKRK